MLQCCLYLETILTKFHLCSSWNYGKILSRYNTTNWANRTKKNGKKYTLIYMYIWWWKTPLLLSLRVSRGHQLLVVQQLAETRRSELKIFDCLRKIRQLDVFDLLWNVHVLHGRDGSSWGRCYASLQDNRNSIRIMILTPVVKLSISQILGTTFVCIVFVVYCIILWQ